MQQAGSAFAGVSFHCYQGTVSQQMQFTSVYPTKVCMLLTNSKNSNIHYLQEVYFTECSGTIGSDWWSDIKVSIPTITDVRTNVCIVVYEQPVGTNYVQNLVG